MEGSDKMADRLAVKGRKGLWFAAIDSGPMVSFREPERAPYPGIQWEGSCLTCEAPVTFWRPAKRWPPQFKLCQLCKLERRMARSFACEATDVG